MDPKQNPRGKVPSFPSIGQATAASRVKAASKPKAATHVESHEKRHHGKFATAINCMDGRVQVPVINWLKENLGVDYVDMITEPGPDKLLAEGDTRALNSIKARVLISVNKHGSDTILVAAHDDCAGNPVSRAQHETDVRRSVIRIQSWKLPVKRVLGAWIGDNWKVEIIEASR
jgi:carbonic anhydrase